MKLISFVIPCYNSANTIGSVIEEISNVVLQRSSKYDYEIIAVVDGSPDNVFSVLKDIARNNPRVKIVNLANNFGKANAEMAGYNNASGDYIVTLDDDGQCPMDKVWDLIGQLEQGADMAVAKYPKKKQSFFKNIGSRLNILMGRTLLGFPKDFETSNFTAFDRLLLEEVSNYDNPYPYFYGIAFRSTKRIVNVEMEERERSEGNSNFTFRKSLSMWLNGFTSFTIKPLRIADLVGFLFASVGFLFGLYTVINRIMNPDIAAGYSSLLSILLLIGGIIMVLLGLIGEYIGRIYICINHLPQYVVRDKVNFKNERSEHRPPQ